MGGGAPFEGGEELLEGEAGRVLRPRVLEAAAGRAEGVLRVGGGLEDRDGDGSRDRLRLLPRVDAEGSEAGDSRLVHAGASGASVARGPGAVEGRARRRPTKTKAGPKARPRIARVSGPFF